MTGPLVFPVQAFPDLKHQAIAIDVSADEAGLGELDADIAIRTSISVGLEVFRQHTEVHMVLSVQAGATLVCGRCLDPVDHLLTTRFRMIYRPVALRPGFLQDVEEAGLGYYEAGIIDIREDVRRFLLIEVPLWPVCSDDCRGLCHYCGTNLNHDTCSCPEKKGSSVGTGGLEPRIRQRLG